VTGFLLDTNVLSEFSRSAIPPNPRVRRWVNSLHPDVLFTSVLSIGEIRKGIQLLPPSKKRSELEQWLDRDLNGWFEDNLPPVTKSDFRPLGNSRGQVAAEGETLGQH